MISQFASIETEQSALGCILVQPELIESSRLKPEDYYYAGHRFIFESMQGLNDEGKPIDAITLADRMGNELMGMGGVSYLTQLSNAAPSISNFDFYETIIWESSMRRKTLETLKKKFDEGKGVNDPEEFLASIQDEIEALAKQTEPTKSFKSMGDVLNNHEDIIIERQKQKGLTGVKTASSAMDRLTGGYQKQDLVIIAARPSIGKTAYMLNDAISAARSKTVDAVGIISLEMPDMPVAERVVSAVGHIDGMKIRTGLLADDEWGKYTMSRQIVADLPLWIDDSPGVTIQQIAAKVKAFRKQHGRVIIFIDYLQLIDGGKRFANKNEEVGYISGKLKQIARENDCPIVVISSLSRSVEQRQDKRPMMSDLRESGKIEFDADMVIFLYRDDYYNADTEKKNIVEVIVAKGRNTGTGLIEMVYFKNYSKFADIEYSGS
ncbi:replicative DNA helicase DnaC [Paenibacillus alvei DSM 29]|nr:replicative DNA helicase [Paenibacillus alvei]EJW20045.1 replicative DNA helicase DnaC [Paenibacillus alvei DSM 29]